MAAEKEEAGRFRGAGGKVSKVEAAVFVGIVLLAAVARLARPGLTEFKADEGRLLTSALEMAGGEFAVRGISSSVGFPNAPMSVWLYSLPLVVWPHPYAATFFTGLLGVAAVAGVYWLGRRYWGVPAANVAALMMAVSPWAILFSRKIWAQDLLPVFAVGWAIAAALAFVEGRRSFIILHLVCLAIAIQIHPAAIGLAPATLLFLIVFRRQVDWRMTILGGLLAALTAGPFLSYLWGRWQSEGGLPFSTSQSVAEYSLDSLRLTLSVVVGEGIRPLAGATYAGLPGENVVRVLWLLLIISGTGWAVYQVARRWEQPAAQAAFICLAWFLVPALLFVWHWTPVYIHYFIVALPAPYLMAGALFGRVLRQARPLSRGIAWSGILVLCLLQLATLTAMMAFIEQNPLAGGFGIPLGAKLAAADGARRLMHDTGADEVLIAGSGSNPEHEDFPAEFRALLHDVPKRYVDLRAEAVFPSAAAVVLLDTTLDEAITSTRALYTTAATSAETFNVTDEIAYSALALPPLSIPTADVELSPAPLLANFVRVAGHNDLSVTQEGAVWDLYWRPADNPDPADYHFFNHLLDGNGTRIAQTDGAAFGGWQWRAGDVVVSRFLLPLTVTPEFPLTMRAGMYRFPSLDNVPVLDEAANPAADAVDLPLTD